LRTMFAVLAMLARLLLIALIGLALARLTRLLAVVAHIRLRLLRHEAGLLAKAREILAVVLAFLAHDLVSARLLLMLRLALAELFLGRRDQAEIMLGVLVVVLGGDRVAGGTGIARQLQIFFRDMGCGAADLDVGAVRFEHPGHRVLAAPVIVMIVI